MKKLVAILTCILLVVSVFPISAAALQEDIIILYENDVHCAIEGYSKLAAMKKELQQSYTHVGVVSGGDYIQGNSLGVISTGAYMISLMNLIGYDAAALGRWGSIHCPCFRICYLSGRIYAGLCYESL